MDVILQSIFDALPEFLSGAGMIIGAASAIAAITPTPRDDELLGKAYKLIELLALNFGRAKDVPANRRGEGLRLPAHPVAAIAAALLVLLTLSGCGGLQGLKADARRETNQAVDNAFGYCGENLECVGYRARRIFEWAAAEVPAEFPEANSAPILEEIRLATDRVQEAQGNPVAMMHARSVLRTRYLRLAKEVLTEEFSALDAITSVPSFLRDFAGFLFTRSTSAYETFNLIATDVTLKYPPPADLTEFDLAQPSA